MAQVFLWKPYLGPSRQKRVGHISMWLQNGTYISFWPEESLKHKAIFWVTGGTKTYDQDVESEGGEPDEKIEIPENLIDYAKIQMFWRETLKGNYSFLVKNCATTVKQAVKIGCKFAVTSLYAADPQYVFTQIRQGLEYNFENGGMASII